MEWELHAPFSKEQALALHAGDLVYLSGTVYTARDAAHQRLCDSIAKGESLPLDLKDAAIYFVGPTPPPPGYVVGAAGPTSSYRMDAYSPALLQLGLRCMIGKGRRSQEVIQAMQRYGAVYLCAVGGAGALLSQCIRKSELIAYEDLGTEAIRRLEVEHMPLTVAIDAYGENLYETGRTAYLASREAGRCR